MKKYIVAFLLIASMLFQCKLPTYADKKTTFISPRCKQEDNLPEEEIIWNLLVKYSPNEYIAAGIMGMYYRESHLQSDQVACIETYNNEKEARNKLVRETVDAGFTDGSSKEYFIQEINYHYGGYGLGQWCWKNIPRLYDFAQEWGTTIADAEMQIAFTLYDLENYYPDLWEILINDVKDANLAGSKLATYYDGTGADWVIGNHAEYYYEKYSVEKD